MPSRICILCPGQGAQAVGMGKDFFESSIAAREVFQRANQVLGFDLASICFGGPEDRLNQTDVSQPAIFTTGVACFRAACEAGAIDPQAVKAYAGLSLGEYTALHLTGVFGFEDGLRLVAARGRLMQEAAGKSAGGMVALMGADEMLVNELCQQCAEGEVLGAANFNSPSQIVVSGSLTACQRLAKAAEGRQLKAMPLKVAGAFHSALMQPAADRMAEELARVSFMKPRTTVYANVTAGEHGEPDSIKDLLVKQVVKPVRWEQTMNALIAGGEWRYVELAPGRTLTGLAKKINRRLPVESLGTFESLAAARPQG